jgi:hypothetical protein
MTYLKSDWLEKVLLSVHSGHVHFVVVVIMSNVELILQFFSIQSTLNCLLWSFHLTLNSLGLLPESVGKADCPFYLLK